MTIPGASHHVSEPQCVGGQPVRSFKRAVMATKFSVVRSLIGTMVQRFNNNPPRLHSTVTSSSKQSRPWGSTTVASDQRQVSANNRGTCNRFLFLGGRSVGCPGGTPCSARDLADTYKSLECFLESAYVHFSLTDQIQQQQPQLVLRAEPGILQALLCIDKGAERDLRRQGGGGWSRRGRPLGDTNIPPTSYHKP